MAATVEVNQTKANTDAQAAAAADSDKPYMCRICVKYDSASDAEMVMKALAVDKELRPEQVTKTFQLEGSNLIIQFASTDVRTLRSAVGSFCDLMGLATRTLEAFGQKASTARPAAAVSAQPMAMQQ